MSILTITFILLFALVVYIVLINIVLNASAYMYWLNRIINRKTKPVKPHQRWQDCNGSYGDEVKPNPEEDSRDG